MKPCVFIQTNAKQIAGAIVAAHALKRNSPNADKFDVKIVKHEDYSYFQEMEGRPYLRDRIHRQWQNDDLQSFTLTRFMPPELMGYKGKAVMACRPKNPLKEREGQLASSVMLLDCSKLKHWNVKQQFLDMFDDKIDYMDWISLKLEPRETIGILEPEWNHYDTLNAKTKMIHNTKRRTQPWKSGLPVDFMTPERNRKHPLVGWVWRWRRRIFGPYAFLGRYKSHPDKRQEDLFFSLLRECLENGSITEGMIKHEMRANHVRHDALEVIRKVPDLSEVMPRIKSAA